jgi:hypothetical protein
MWQGREPTKAELAYAPARRQQVAGLKAALNPNMSFPERAAQGFAAVAATPVVIAEGLTWGAGGRAADALGEHAYKAWTAPTLADAAAETLQAGQQGLAALNAFGAMVTPAYVRGIGQNPRVLSGHGAYIDGAGTTTVPRGTSLTTWTEHGNTISDSLGNAIESGQFGSIDFNRFGPQLEGARTYLPGSQVPNYTLFPPEGLNIVGNPTTVSQPTMLNHLLRRNMGNVNWAACQECIGPMPLPPPPPNPGAAAAASAAVVILNDEKQRRRR